MCTKSAIKTFVSCTIQKAKDVSIEYSPTKKVKSHQMVRLLIQNSRFSQRSNQIVSSSQNTRQGNRGLWENGGPPTSWCIFVKLIQFLEFRELWAEKVSCEIKLEFQWYLISAEWWLSLIVSGVMYFIMNYCSPLLIPSHFLPGLTHHKYLFVNNFPEERGWYLPCIICNRIKLCLLTSWELRRKFTEWL